VNFQQISAVIPAQAGTQYSEANSGVYWIPACAGMTAEERGKRMQLLPINRKKP
jgi:hypothetical protein